MESCQHVAGARRFSLRADKHAWNAAGILSPSSTTLRCASKETGAHGLSLFLSPKDSAFTFRWFYTSSTNPTCQPVSGAYAQHVNGRWSKCLPYLFIVVAALSRWPGLFPPNFSAFYALAFCAGAFFPTRIKWWFPLGTL